MDHIDNASVYLQKLKDAVESLSVVGGGADSTFFSPQSQESVILDTLDTITAGATTGAATGATTSAANLDSSASKPRIRGKSGISTSTTVLILLLCLLTVIVVYVVFFMPYPLVKKRIDNKTFEIKTTHSGRSPEEPLEIQEIQLPVPAAPPPPPVETIKNKSVNFVDDHPNHTPRSIGGKPKRPSSRTSAMSAIGAISDIHPPSDLPNNASREDLVKFAREHAAYYAAQGVPQHEAMVYITSKLSEFINSKPAEPPTDSADNDEEYDDTDVVVVSPQTSSKISSPRFVQGPVVPAMTSLPLIEKLTSTFVPVTDESNETDFTSEGRRRKISSESKEVEEYMKRRQAVLKTDSNDTNEVANNAANNTANDLSMPMSTSDPGETML